jgi:hypothetical protein
VRRLVKDFAKASIETEADLPREVARVLYVLALLPLEEPARRRVSSLDPASLEREARRCLTYGWLPARTRAALVRGLAPEGGGPGRGSGR